MNSRIDAGSIHNNIRLKRVGCNQGEKPIRRSTLYQVQGKNCTIVITKRFPQPCLAPSNEINSYPCLGQRFGHELAKTATTTRH
jgi:hypothetical protein